MPIEKAILTGITRDALSTFEETEVLAATASVKVLERMIQGRDRPDPSFFVGKGKVHELKEKCKELGAGLILFNNTLKPGQQRNLEDETGLKIVDRSTLILDIFAKHARTNEGYLQIELAQLIYLLPRLSGEGVELSQLGGGIGTRGPGETKLEVDKRKIRDRIVFLKGKLEVVRNHRKVLRESRKAKGFLTTTLVGYTNAGKSTLLNLLTKSDVLVENKLFSTLDPTTRKLYLPGGINMLLTDTVGFIQNLPAELVTAFRATLEEIAFSDIIVVVLDAGRADIGIQQDAVYRELKALNSLGKPIITVLNKTDLVTAQRLLRLKNDIPDAIPISAGENDNIEQLLSKIALISHDLLTNS